MSSTPTKIPVKGYTDTTGNDFITAFLPVHYIVSQYIDMNNNIVSIPNATNTAKYNFCVGVPVFVNQQVFLSLII